MGANKRRKTTKGVAEPQEQDTDTRGQEEHSYANTSNISAPVDAPVSAYAVRTEPSLFNHQDYTSAALSSPQYNRDSDHEDVYSNNNYGNDSDDNNTHSETETEEVNLKARVQGGMNMHHSRSLKMGGATPSVSTGDTLHGSTWKWTTNACYTFTLTPADSSTSTNTHQSHANTSTSTHTRAPMPERAAAVVILQPEEALGVVGCADMCVLDGTADVNGYSMRSSEAVSHQIALDGFVTLNMHTLVSSRSLSVLSIRPADSKADTRTDMRSPGRHRRTYTHSKMQTITDTPTEMQNMGYTYSLPESVRNFINRQTNKPYNSTKCCVILLADTFERLSPALQTIRAIETNVRTGRYMFSLPNTLAKTAYAECLKLTTMSLVPQMQSEIALFRAPEDWYLFARDVCAYSDQTSIQDKSADLSRAPAAKKRSKRNSENTGTSTNVDANLGPLDAAACPVIAVVGGKDVGKSTFARFMVNRLLGTYKNVAYLDSDLGQCEFTPPGLVSLTVCETPLLAPPAFHSQTTNTMGFVGDTTPKSNPFVYLRRVRELVRKYRTLAQEAADKGYSLPLVINTHGWIKGIGLELVFRVVAASNPTHVVQFAFESNGPSAIAMPLFTNSMLKDAFKQFMSLDCYADPSPRDILDGTFPQSANLQLIHPQFAVPSEYTSNTENGDSTAESMASEHALTVLAPCSFRTPISAKYRNADLRMLSMRTYFAQHGVTYEVPISQLCISVLNEEVQPENILFAINGCLVGLISSISDNSVCEGLGIVKGVDMEQLRLHIYTPVAESQLKLVNRIVRGPLNMADGFSELFASKIPGTVQPYKMSTATTKALGSALRKSRANLVRRKNITS
ncbi:hypothetical protein SARC_08078 [Sphaeroforma arctica JP610]|uniref:Uncharacterized protein n=1 Tax=Sphaeroforma arctica JP610 TaxID=667725 RepID=A0A0L0FS47_9EUKA|nr:hypothetical protein SARC_08078 [Sphaeroforma arctica JP610]KNC79534.1 hypothetical protein SARC_08078 [Sphaeroforma arctica JP610]|eukprot:XP_014153436.1 hypothetical protein SARC_08078 [Sphaeroforma arctica JP610]